MNTHHWSGLDTDSQRPRYDLIGSLLTGSVLDVGCGTGILGRYTNRYCGIEAQDEVANTAQRCNPHGTIVLGSAEEMVRVNVLGRIRWDTIVFNESLYYMRNPVRVLNEYRVKHLQPGGQIIVSVYLRPHRHENWLFLSWFRKDDNVTVAGKVDRYFHTVQAHGKVTRWDVPQNGTYPWRVWCYGTQKAYIVPSPIFNP
jgi:SAM-dependent methyltransferase